MESKHSLRKSKLFRALLILLLIAVPVQWAAAQLTLSTPRTTLGTVIKQIQSQSKYQFFYNDKLSTVTVEPLKVKDASINYGSFIQNIINFLIIAFCIFILVKVINKFLHKAKEEEKKEEPTKSDEVILLEEIRDLLKNKNNC